MIDSIVMYPLDVMPLELGLNVLGLSSPELLFKFVEGLQGFGDDVVLGDGSKTAVLTKSRLLLFSWVRLRVVAVVCRVRRIGA